MANVWFPCKQIPLKLKEQIINMTPFFIVSESELKFPIYRKLLEEEQDVVFLGLAIKKENSDFTLDSFSSLEDIMLCNECVSIVKPFEIILG